MLSVSTTRLTGSNHEGSGDHALIHLFASLTCGFHRARRATSILWRNIRARSSASSSWEATLTCRYAPRRQRSARTADAASWNSRRHAQAIRSQSSEEACIPFTGEQTMTAGAACAKPSPEQNWLPILERATQEVFEIMLGCQVKPAEPAAPKL